MLGTLTAINPPEGSDFTTGDMELLATLANHAAIAIERALLLAELRYQATVDGLTQLPNRRFWFEQSQRILALAERAAQPHAVLLMDADHFKQINDSYGHDVGDRVLLAIGQILQQAVRKSDLVGRYGGEEFVMLLPETDAPTALQIAERIRQSVAEQSLVIGEHRLTVTISLGVTTTDGQPLNLAALLHQADQALYAAKRAGRNRTCLWHE
jgi:diguanylate cyclase (GGDEF)-like protein